MSENYFSDLNQIDVSSRVEKKGGFTYLSWAYAVGELKKRHPKATWEVIRSNGLPFLQTELGYFVEVSVTVEGVTHSQIHPVLDNRNKPITKPNAFEINTSLQRALVKAIALHGLGLYIYAGEDLPEKEPTIKVTPDAVDDDKVFKASVWFKEMIDADNIEKNWEIVQAAYKKLSNNERMAIDEKLKDKATGSDRAYRNILKTYLAHVPQEGV